MKSFLTFYDQVRKYNEGPAYDPNTGLILNQDALRQGTIQGMKKATNANVQGQQMMQQGIPEITRQAIQEFERLLPHKKQLGANMGKDAEVKQFLAKYPPQVQQKIQSYYGNQQAGMVAKGEAAPMAQPAPMAKLSPWQGRATAPAAIPMPQG